MKNYKWTGLFPALLCIMMACGPQQAEETASAPAKTEDSLAANQQLQMAGDAQKEPDSTLQDLEELTLHAIGDDNDSTRFDQDTLEVKAGAKVVLLLINEGTEQSMIHNIIITKRGKAGAIERAGKKIGASGSYVPTSPDVIASSPLALPGQKVTIEFNAPAEAATYDFVCTYPEHHHPRTGLLVVKK
ncbi:plastocyanin/azurin family copper-binding protein [Pontibacter sp. SGAir0037]|uniref:plastocyanin/azurin family copper-binding protein n=1 Tax=Pontibacter sp. SGAir0037 TaxID=2571030 RepID=UPI0010CD65A2|nr:plastocyanin/azurin family copper-binding protein [Pontibacter sp. SGAir0037]QCR22212.1 azurin [Pontibacter sp. SGAir0037]